MEKIKLAVTARNEQKPRALRHGGSIPGTIYGAGKQSESVQMDAREFSRLPAAAMSHMIELNNGGKNRNVIIRHVQRVGTTHKVLNVEFYEVSLNKPLAVQVPIKWIGESPAQKEGNLISEHFMEVEIECLPAEIPDFIEVDISGLKEVGDSVHFGQLKLGKNIKVLNPADEIIVNAMAPRTVEPEEPVAEVAAAEESAEAPAEGEAATEEKAEA